MRTLFPDILLILTLIEMVSGKLTSKLQDGSKVKGISNVSIIDNLITDIIHAASNDSVVVITDVKNLEIRTKHSPHDAGYDNVTLPVFTSLQPESISPQILLDLKTISMKLNNRHFIFCCYQTKIIKIKLSI